MFSKQRVITFAYLLLVGGIWLSNNIPLLVILVYAPQHVKDKITLWNQLCNIVDAWNGSIILMGDSNKVRFEYEWYGSVFHSSTMYSFNAFIANSCIVDIPFKLDVFLISKNLLVAFPNLIRTILDRHLSDHLPILLKELVVDYGPSQFRVFHSWLYLEDFIHLVEDSWKNYGVGEVNTLVSQKKKLQELKKIIKQWDKSSIHACDASKCELCDSWADLEHKVDMGEREIEDSAAKLSILKQLDDLEHVEAMDMAQKSKISWAIEGDEN